MCHQLLEVMESWTSIGNSDGCIDAVYLDFAKAFCYSAIRTTQETNCIWCRGRSIKVDRSLQNMKKTMHISKWKCMRVVRSDKWYPPGKRLWSHSLHTLHKRPARWN